MVSIAQRLFSFVAAIGVLMPFSAWACRTLTPDKGTIAGYDDVVFVKITAGERLRERGWNKWRLSARRVRATTEPGSQNDYEFTTIQSSLGCGRTPLPAPGEIWVLYFRQSQPATVAEAFPLSKVREYDPRLDVAL